MKKILAIILAAVLLCCTLAGCKKSEKSHNAEENLQLGSSLDYEESMELKYASCFSVDYYKGGYKLISLSDGSRFITVPQGGTLPADIPQDITPIYQPVENIYLTATSAMCLFDALGRCDAIKLSGTREDGWYIESAVNAMKNGDMLYAGKYNQPDYELLLENSCPLAVESTMIGKASDVKEKLESLDIAVLVDQSGLEPHPLGRAEWIRLYGALLDEEKKAESEFLKQVEYLSETEKKGKSAKTVAFFHVNSNGGVVVRQSSDYMSKMIELAGGEYVFNSQDSEEKSTSTKTIEMEAFFAAAKDADVIIYNSTIGGEIKDISELCALNPLLAELKAVKSGNVWCTARNMFQETMQLGKMIENFSQILNPDEDTPSKLEYLYKLQ